MVGLIFCIHTQDREDYSARNREDYSAFRVSACCFNPRAVPLSRDLHVVEPPVGDILSPPRKPTLVYPVSIAILEVLSALSGEDADSSDGGSFGRRQQRESHSVGGRPDESAAATASVRELARDRLGPTVSGACHVAYSV